MQPDISSSRWHAVGVPEKNERTPSGLPFCFFIFFRMLVAYRFIVTEDGQPHAAAHDPNGMRRCLAASRPRLYAKFERSPQHFAGLRPPT